MEDGLSMGFRKKVFNKLSTGLNFQIDRSAETAETNCIIGHKDHKRIMFTAGVDANGPGGAVKIVSDEIIARLAGHSGVPFV